MITVVEKRKKLLLHTFYIFSLNLDSVVIFCRITVISFTSMKAFQKFGEEVPSIKQSMIKTQPSVKMGPE